MNNSSLNMFGITLSKSAGSDQKTIKNQISTDSVPAQAFKSLLLEGARTSATGGIAGFEAGVKNLPLDSAALPKNLLKEFPELEQLSAEQLVKLLKQLGIGLTDNQIGMLQVADGEASSAISKLIKSMQDATGLESALPLAGQLPAVTPMPLDDATPIDADRLIKTATSFGTAPRVAEVIVNTAGTTPTKPLVDDDLLALSKEASEALLSKAATPALTTQVSQRADLAQMMQQMQARLKVKAAEPTGGVVGGKISAALTAESFLTSRSLTAQQFAQARLQSDLLPQRSLITPQTGIGIDASGVTSASNIAPGVVQLTAMDASQHATAQLQRMPEQQLLSETFNTVQNQERLQRAMGERVMQMVESGKWDAEMELYPARLGTIRIRMSMENSELQLVMTSQTTAVKEMLEAGMPRLRDSLQEQGIQLANSSVQQDGSGQGRDAQLAYQSTNTDRGSAQIDETNPADQVKSSSTGSGHDGELDTFA